MKVAIIHYWLVNMRGGEKVLEALLDIFPEADIFTHVYVPEAISEKIKSHRIFTTKTGARILAVLSHSANLCYNKLI